MCNVCGDLREYYRDQICFSMQHLLPPEGGVETLPRKAKVLTTPRGLVDINVSEKHVWSLLLHKIILSLKILEKRFIKFIFVSL